MVGLGFNQWSQPEGISALQAPNGEGSTSPCYIPTHDHHHPTPTSATLTGGLLIPLMAHIAVGKNRGFFGENP